MIFSTVCFQPIFARDAELDVSCFFCNGFAFAKRLRFGVDFLGSYGPWSFVIHNLYHPHLYGWMIAGQCIISTGLFVGLWQVGKNLGMAPLARGLWILLFSMWDVTVFEDGHLLTICLLPMLIRRTSDTQRDSVASYIVVLAIALCALCKFTFFAGAIIAIGLLCVEDLLRRRWPAIGLWFVGMVVVLWRIAGQRVADLFIYLWREGVLSRTYSESVGIEPADRWLVPTVAVLSLLVCIMAAARFWKGNRLGAVVALLTTAGTLFVCFKEGFVRSMGVYVATTGLALCAMMLGPVFWIGRRGWRGGVFRALSVVVILIAFWRIDPGSSLLSPIHPSALFAVDVRMMEERAGAFVQWITQGEGAFDPAYEIAMDRIHKDYPLPFRSGTVDLFGTNQLAVLAAGMDYHPRPLSPGFQAWSPELIDMNRRFVTGSDGPAHIFFEHEAIDDRFPSLEDGALWPELLSRYSADELVSKDLLILRRNAQRQPYRFSVISDQVYRMDEEIAAPSMPGEIIWAHVKVRPTLLGKVGATLLRGPRLDIDITTAGGAVSRYRLIPGMAEAGFVLSPVVRNASEFLALMIDSKALPQVQRFSIHVEPTGLFEHSYDPAVEVRFERLEIQRGSAW